MNPSKLRDSYLILTINYQTLSKMNQESGPPRRQSEHDILTLLSHFKIFYAQENSRYLLKVKFFAQAFKLKAVLRLLLG